MFEWICPQCDRAVLIESKECPHCAEQRSAAAAQAAAPAEDSSAAQGAPARRVVRRTQTHWAGVWADIEKGFRFGLGFLAALAVGYFVLFFCTYVYAEPETFSRIARWLRLPGL